VALGKKKEQDQAHGEDIFYSRWMLTKTPYVVYDLI
jgi:hypothetical protein